MSVISDTGDLDGTYAINSNLGFYAVLPLGVVQKRAPETRLPGIVESEDFTFGIGDINGGMYYHLLDETDHLPNIIHYCQYCQSSERITRLDPSLSSQKNVDPFARNL